MIILPPFIRHLIKLALLTAVFWAPLYTAPQSAEAAASPGLRLRAWEIVQEAPTQSAVEPAASPQAEPAATPKAGAATTPKAEPAATPQAEKLKVKIKAIKITGAVVITPEELSPVTAPYIGQDMSLADLQKIADLITEEYRNRGYNLARALVPEQEIKDGVVEIKVLEARIGEIKIQGNQYFATDLFRRAMGRVERDRAVKQASLEKSLLLLNDNPDIKATASLQAGAEDGTTDILVTVEDKVPLHFSLDYNNFGSRIASRHLFGPEMSFAEPWYGSQFTLRGVVGFDPEFTSFKRGTYTLPFYRLGTKYIFSYGIGDFDVGGNLRELHLNGASESWGFSFVHPFIRSRFYNFAAELGFDLKDTTLLRARERLTRDRIRLVKVGLNYDATDSTGRTLVSLYVFQGMGDMFGGMKVNNPVSSRVHHQSTGVDRAADGDFTYGTLSLARFQRIGSYVSLLLRTSGLLSSASLVASEQFTIGGPDSVRGFEQKEIVGDEGFNASSELRLSLWPDSDMAQFAVFVDYGLIHQREVSSGQQKYQSLFGYGPGLRLNLPYNFSFRFDAGFPITPSKNAKGIDPLYYLQASIRY